jgi:hypothetical protein
VTNIKGKEINLVKNVYIRALASKKYIFALQNLTSLNQFSGEKKKEKEKETKSIKQKRKKNKSHGVEFNFWVADGYWGI